VGFLVSFVNREVPRVMEIYDIVHMGVPAIRKAIRSHFYHHDDIKDERVVAMLVEKGYIDLEDTLLQHKQKSQLMILLEGPTQTDQNHKILKPNSTIDEQFTRWIS
jgi:hypothetical protein